MMFSLFQQPVALLASYLPFLSTMKSGTLSTAALLTSSSAAKVFDLSEANWTLTRPGNESFSGIEGKVPSQAHLDLYAAGVIPDPYFGLNDFDLRWVAGSNWSYSASVEGL
jgi:beta-mannosidase